MEYFDSCTRVRIVKGSLKGRTGTIVRKRINDTGAWIKVDGGLPEKLRSFDVGDSRQDNVLLYPEDCEPEKP